MAITASMVKELREMTGAGMMDCKKALTATEGDMDKAVDFLREKGLAGAQKKQSRIAAEGIARVAVNGNVAVVAEVNSETDFVAKNETFQEFVQTVADTALASDLNGGANGEVENFIDQWNQKLRHFLRDGSKYIVKNRAVSCSVFCVGIRQRSCHNVSVPHVVSYLSFSIYHKHLFLQYGKYKKQLL